MESESPEIDTVSIRRLLESGEITTVICAATDIWGRLMGKRLLIPTFLGVLDGDPIHASKYLFVVDMDMDPQPGFALTDWARGFDDFELVPDLSTFRVISWAEGTALVLCDCIDEKTREPLPISPRSILKRQIELARDAGFSVNCASEVEVFFFQDTYEEAWNKKYRDLRPIFYYRSDYHILQTTKDEWFISQIREDLNNSGIPIESSKGEWGLGQYEINLRYADALEMADRHSIYKTAIKEIAALNGLSATFMPKWSVDDVGSSCHLHTSIWSPDGSTPLGADANDPDHPSSLFGAYIGGQMAAARELTLLNAPTVNAYRRYIPDSFAPTRVSYGHDNRTCSLRLVGHGSSMRIENRLPGADVNPYLVMAAAIAAGLHGVASEMTLPEPCVGNAYDSDGEEVPVSYEDAIDAFSRSAVARSAFGDDVFEHLVQLYRHEAAAYARYLDGSGVDPAAGVTEWELTRYFERG
jgi:glutamine synthetase